MSLYDQITTHELTIDVLKRQIEALRAEIKHLREDNARLKQDAEQRKNLKAKGLTNEKAASEGQKNEK